MSNKRFLYGQVYDDIVMSIKNGTLNAKDKLKNEEELSEYYKVSAITIKKAFSLLKAEGIVQRISGVGTFVTENAKEVLLKREDDKPKEFSEKRVIGVVLEHVASPFGLEMMYTLDQEAEKHGYKLCIRFSYTDQKKEAEEIDFLLSMGVCGLIIMPSHAKYYNTKILKLMVDGFPVVLIDKRLDGVPVPAVYNDNEKSMQLIVDYLYDKGHRDIGLITTPSGAATSLVQRGEGFYAQMNKYGLATVGECLLSIDSYIVDDNTERCENVRILEEYFASNPQLTAVVTLEFGLLSHLDTLMKRKQMLVPRDMSVVTIDENYDQASECFYTHIKQDEYEIGKKAIGLMILHLEKGKVLIGKNYKIPPIFVERDSVAEV